MSQIINPTIYRKVLRMVQELHVMGFQSLRISPGMSPSGNDWRCVIAPAKYFLRRNGAILSSPAYDLAAKYSSADERSYFGLKDAQHLRPFELAKLFVDKFPDIIKESKNRDWEYVGWYVEMMHLTYPNHFPVAYTDMESYDKYLTSQSPVGDQTYNPIRIPLPPSGFIEN